jgi:transcription elongation factor GreA
MPRQFQMTSAGRIVLEDELRQLLTRRGEVADMLAAAISQGDLSENAEYQEGKYQQAIVEGRIAELETVLANAVIVEPTADHTGTVGLFTIVTVLDLDCDEEIEYTLVPPFEADYRLGRISVESPLGEGLLGRSEGEEVEIDTPGGVTKLRILSLRGSA